MHFIYRFNVGSRYTTTLSICNKCLKTTIVGLILLIMQSGYAQQRGDTLPRKILPEMVVTATKFNTLPKETTRQVQVISSEEIAQSSAQDIAQLLQRESGILVANSYSNPGAVKSLFVRGGINAYTSILIDGIPVTDPSSVGVGALDLRLLPLGQIERIEIMKGSQSSLYGSGAISGVVNIITKKDSDKKFDINSNVSVGTFGTGKADINIGVRAKKMVFNLGAQHFFTEGVSAAKPRQRGLIFEKDRFRRNGLNANILFKPVNRVTINPYVRFVTNEGSYDGGAFVDADSNVYRASMVSTGAIIGYDAKKFRTRLSYGYTHIDRKFSTPRSTFGGKGRLHDLDGYASYDLMEDILTLSGGLNYNRQQMLDTAASVSNPSVYIFSNYWNVTAKPLKGLISELSYRLNVHAQYGVNHTYSVATAWWVVKNIKLFASYNTGYKAPTLGQLYGRFGSNKLLRPQQSTSWEAGGEAYLLQNKLKFTATYYNRNIKNVIAYASKGYENRDLQHNHGVELAIQWKPTDRIDMKLLYDFMRGSITKPTQQLSDTTYNNMLKRPAHSLKAIVVYKPLKQAVVRLTGQYIGDRIDSFFDASFFASVPVDVKAYFLLNAYLEYGFLLQRIFIFVDLRNITNIDFSETYGYTTPGFGLQAGLRLSF